MCLLNEVLCFLTGKAKNVYVQLYLNAKTGRNNPNPNGARHAGRIPKRYFLLDRNVFQRCSKAGRIACGK